MQPGGGGNSKEKKKKINLEGEVIGVVDMN
jgi:hypothetical protein